MKPRDLPGRASHNAHDILREAARVAVRNGDHEAVLRALDAIGAGAVKRAIARLDAQRRDRPM